MAYNIHHHIGIVLNAMGDLKDPGAIMRDSYAEAAADARAIVASLYAGEEDAFPGVRTVYTNFEWDDEEID